MSTSIGIKQPPAPDHISPRGRLLMLGACQIAAIRTNRLKPVNTIAYNEAIRDSVKIAEDIMNECFRTRRYLYEE